MNGSTWFYSSLAYLCTMKKGLFLLLLTLWISVSNAIAQGCAMCKSSASNLNEEAARGLNAGILYLAAFPLIFMGVTVYYWYRKNRAVEETNA